MTSMPEPKPGLRQRVRRFIVGAAKSHEDHKLFHHLSLIAFFAWVGLGADGLSSANYGPEEAYLALHGHHYLALLVGIASVITIFVISTSYTQIIELFPTGGGGYLVATKLLSPNIGVLSGCALMVDYVLTIALSIASGADAIFSFFPTAPTHYKFFFAMAGILMLTMLNMRGVKESVVPLVPIFICFIVTHVFAILYAVVTHMFELGTLTQETVADISAAHTEQGGGWVGLFFLSLMVLKAYSLGAGTYTGIEAVSNGVSILREPRVQTARRTMRYMTFSLAFMVMGLMTAYLIFKVEHQPGKTLNAVLFETMTADWPRWLASSFVFLSLSSAAALLFIAAQTGFMDGPRVAANMALDSWFPKRFATLSDRFVNQNGIVYMGAAAAAVLCLAYFINAARVVKFLVVLYSINVFIDFVLAQAGMVRHWWRSRATVPTWRRKITVNGIGLAMCSFILLSIIVLKFYDGGWVTLVVTGCLVAACFAIRHHYRTTGLMLHRLDGLARVAEQSPEAGKPVAVAPACDPQAKTAVVLVNGFTGVGLHTLFSVVRLFGNTFKNYVFIQVGAIDAGVFKGVAEIEKLKEQVSGEVDRYVTFMTQNGYYAEGLSSIGVDIVEEATKLAPQVLEKFPQCVFFGGQLVFPTDSLLVRWLHNYTVFALQRQFYLRGIPFVILPIRV